MNTRILSICLVLLTSTIILPAVSARGKNSIYKLSKQPEKIESVDSTAYKATPKNNAIPQYDNYKLTWSDEFNIDGKPSPDWNYEKGFVRNNEMQWYQSDNASVKDGCLIIEGKAQHFSNPKYDANSKNWRYNRKEVEYTSASITTAKSKTFKYGRFEVRAKIPVASGSWPAIWLLGNQWEWPSNGEIDMMEYYIKYGQPSILANACWGSKNRHNAIWDSSVTPLSHFTEKDAKWGDKFHIWRMDWDEEKILLYLDNELLNTIELSKTFNKGYNDNYENPFNTSKNDFGNYILLNLAMGSNGGTIDVTKLPMLYMVDYVRVYQKK